MSVDHLPYRVTWSPEDGGQAGLCAGFPSLSWLARTPDPAVKGIRRVVSETAANMKASKAERPVPPAEKHWRGEFKIRMPPTMHRTLALKAAAQGVSLNRLASAKRRLTLGFYDGCRAPPRFQTTRL
jgi:predicted HicB family RNase H-like nuclease